MTKNTKQAAGYLNLSQRYLEKLRVSGNGPPFSKIGKCVRYRTSDLDEFIERKTIRSTSDMGSP
jgi:excisionase family DNA binding protein